MNPKLILTALVVAFALGIGWWSRGLFDERETAPDSVPSRSSETCADGVAPLHWRAPMDPTFIRPEPGKSPMGMDLVPVCPQTDGFVRVDSRTIQNFGVRTAAVTRRDLGRIIRASGRVAYDEQRIAHVHTKVQGWIEALHADYVGQKVERGQPLLEVYSPELVATQEELLVAARYRDATQASPFEDVRGGGASLFEATRRRLELWDIPGRDIDRLLDTGRIEKNLTLYAPTSGVVTELGVRAGMEVTPNQNLYTIADLSTVWVVADVYESELSWLALGQTGTVELAALAGERLSGPITYIAPFLDPTTRTVEVRLTLANPDGALRPDMFGNVAIQGSTRTSVVAIPSEAVIRSGRRTLVIVALGDGRFAPRAVVPGMDSGDGWIEIAEGLVPGDEIVLSGQFLIDSESNLQAAIERLLAHSAPEDAPGPDAAETSSTQDGQTGAE